MTETSEFIIRYNPKKYEHRHYMTECARLRGISVQALIRGLIDVIAEDQMVISVLDDTKLTNPRNGHVPETNGKLFDAVKRAPSVPTRRAPNRQTINIGKPRAKTREELRRELEEAVRNTAGMPVE